jgi:hypothetical protein
MQHATTKFSKSRPLRRRRQLKGSRRGGRWGQGGFIRLLASHPLQSRSNDAKQFEAQESDSSSLFPGLYNPESEMFVSTTGEHNLVHMPGVATSGTATTQFIGI